MKRLASLLTASLLALSACGGGPASGGPLTIPPGGTEPPGTTMPPAEPTTSTTAPGGVTITVYFLDADGRAVATSRTAQPPAVARAAVEALIAGPSSSEAAAGLSTAFPPDTLLLNLVVADGEATVDLSREFAAGAGAASVLGRLAQLVYSLTEFETVERVQLLIEGRRLQYLSSEGVSVSEPLTRADFTASVPIGAPHGGTGADTWDQVDLPAVTLGSPEVRRVVLVAADDYLNVRATPGVEGALIGRLLPGVAVRVSGRTQRVGASEWLEIATPTGTGWVNGYYLTRSLPPTGWPADPLALLDELARRFTERADFTDLVSEKGLWVAHHDDPVRFTRDQLVGILADPTTYRWGSNALEPGSPEITPRTFAEAVADSFVGAYLDPDRTILVNQVREGPNGRPAQFIVPTEFGGFGFVTVFDPGDDPQYGGLDWVSWVVSLSWEGDELRVVGLTIDQWAP